MIAGYNIYINIYIIDGLHLRYKYYYQRFMYLINLYKSISDRYCRYDELTIAFERVNFATENKTGESDSGHPFTNTIGLKTKGFV